MQIKQSSDWLIEETNKQLAKQLTQEHLLGYCILPEQDQEILFKIECESLGIGDIPIDNYDN